MQMCWNVKSSVSVLVLILAAAAGGYRIEAPDGVSEKELKKVLSVDDLGRQVLIKRPITRAVSLAPSVTEMIFAAGAGDRLIGVTTYCDFPEAARSIEKVGDTQTPNIERIVALKPQVVFVSTASQLETYMQTLEQQGIAVFVTDPKNLDGLGRNLRTLGELFDTEITANALAEQLARRTDAVAVPEREGPRPKVFVQISKEPLFTIGKDSFLTELIGRAGGISVTKDVETAYPKLSKETAAAMDPDVIILSDSEDNREPNDALKNSKAVKNGRVYRINADIISRPGPRLVDALEEIARYLNP